MSPRVALLETPAGFELNSPRVVGRIASFLHERLQNYAPRTMIIPARKRDTFYSPDNPQVVEPLYQADMVFMGPGSPSYAIRQLMDSLAWNIIQARHRLGATLVMASAATIAIGAYALPVYEIYKVGEEPHWNPGLDFFGGFGMPLVFIPHWNNNDGGEELDTSRCFMGQARFTRLMEMLPADMTVLGLDEKTVLAIYPPRGECRVIGQGGVTLLHTGHRHPSGLPDLTGTGLAEVAEHREAHVHIYFNGQTFPMEEVSFFRLPEGGEGIPLLVWERAQEAQRQMDAPSIAEEERLPEEIVRLVEERQTAREQKDWGKADDLRRQIAELGWQVADTVEGNQSLKKAEK